VSTYPDDWTIVTKLRRHLPSDELPDRALCGAFPGTPAVKHLTACHICARIERHDATRVERST
jgi:hypothetical protein